MSKIIPKEELSAYQRWELGSIGDGGSAKPDGPRTVAEVLLPTADDLQRIHDQVRREGYDAGYKEGLATARAEITHIKALAASMTESADQFDKQLAQDLLALSLEIAKQMLWQSLKVKPGLVLSLVREAMDVLPGTSAHPHLVLHPEDAVLVRSFLENELAHGGWKIVEDSRLSRGGCRIESPTSELDATVESRWRKIAASLGTSDEWLE